MKRQRVMPAAACLIIMTLCAAPAGAQQETEISARGALTLANAEAGDADAQNEVGLMYLYGTNGFPEDEEKAVYWFRKAAAQGHADAQFNLGEYYFAWAWELEEAVVWYRKAAEQGHPGGQFALGSACLEGGGGLPVDHVQGMALMRRSAEQGYVPAQLELGRRYYAGKGVPNDYVQSASWYRRAAEQEDPHGQYQLGNAYYLGAGVEMNKSQAAEWYRKAAEQGHAMAQGNLGSLYLNGEGGLQRDFGQALYWYRQAADQGNTLALFNLGAMARAGAGLPKDPVEACKWFMLAGELLAKEEETGAPAWGMPGGPSRTVSDLALQCRKQINELAQSMTPAQVSEAKEKALALAAELRKRQEKM